MNDRVLIQKTEEEVKAYMENLAIRAKDTDLIFFFHHDSDRLNNSWYDYKGFTKLYFPQFFPGDIVEVRLISMNKHCKEEFAFKIIEKKQEPTREKMQKKEQSFFKKIFKGLFNVR